MFYVLMTIIELLYSLLGIYTGQGKVGRFSFAPYTNKTKMILKYNEVMGESNLTIIIPSTGAEIHTNSVSYILLWALVVYLYSLYSYNHT